MEGTRAKRVLDMGIRGEAAVYAAKALEPGDRAVRCLDVGHSLTETMSGECRLRLMLEACTIANRGTPCPLRKTLTPTADLA